MDGVGEWATSSYGIGKGNDLQLLAELHYPHFLGMLYTAFTYYTGFKVNSGEYKLMGLAPYGEPKYAGLILDKLVEVKDDGSLKLNMKYFNYLHGLTMTNGAFDRLFMGPSRKPESQVTQREMDIAASIQMVTEEIMLRMARHVHRETGMENLCLAGGVALNCVGNGRLLREGPFKRLWIQPAAGDAGGAVGVALIIHHKVLGEGRRYVSEGDGMHGSYLGPSYADAEIEPFLTSAGAVYGQQRLFGIEKLNVPRSEIPAATHVDYSARIQTVHRETNPLYHALLCRFEALTGCPVLVNTSFNVRGEPIVCTPKDAYLCFMRTEMDALVLGSCLLEKGRQPPLRGALHWP